MRKRLDVQIQKQKQKQNQQNQNHNTTPKHGKDIQQSKWDSETTLQNN